LVDPINKVYPASSYPPSDCCSSYWWAGMRANVDFSFVAATRRTVRWFSLWGAWLYQFTYPQYTTGSTGVYGEFAYHSEELPFVWLAENLLNGTNEIDLSTKMAWYWSNFAVANDPNYEGAGGSDLYPWPKYTNATDMNLILDLTLSNMTGLRSSQLDLWDANLNRFSTCRT